MTDLCQRTLDAQDPTKSSRELEPTKNEVVSSQGTAEWPVLEPTSRTSRTR